MDPFGSSWMSAVLLNSSHGGAMVDWCSGFFANHHRQFVKDGLPWQRYRLQWCVYMTEFWPSAIDNIRRVELLFPSMVWSEILI